ncbi:hypothetical protein NLA05_20040 [Xanthomonas citri pv. anacardii]|uniref:hypothetical protein n=1 Tax=Xanthomonas citri TaxID=346 RepID=UPI000CCBEE36|nr:hypothetical protein [Xanthomonas citri]MCT8358740.1 hypothetical protein [Xanthomonas citri pv. anacardii]MCT8362573.1 hypothetical protein [Xanthomonas citri pv. anacardii]MCT8366615.1 hypothetical protein [Xanthomonas citri pv. anacardii]MCT8370647.1 hypothetical protein [Xanthomonas citri pv. anacardii]MCT8374648.1 hypothetical protein [Xanthomonas citri pv. anacardii]
MKNSTAVKIALYGGMFYLTARAIWKKPKARALRLPAVEPEQPLVEQEPVPVPVQSKEIAISKPWLSAVTPLGFFIGLFSALALISMPVIFRGGKVDNPSWISLWEYLAYFFPLAAGLSAGIGLSARRKILGVQLGARNESIAYVVSVILLLLGLLSFLAYKGQFVNALANLIIGSLSVFATALLAIQLAKPTGSALAPKRMALVLAICAAFAFFAWFGVIFYFGADFVVRQLTR